MPAAARSRAGSRFRTLTQTARTTNGSTSATGRDEDDAALEQAEQAAG